MRVMTLLPAATEMVAALGGADQLVGISHECDFPPTLGAIPRVTTTPIDPAAPSAAIDAEVRALREAGRPVIAVDAAVLRRLAPLGPDLVIVMLCGFGVERSRRELEALQDAQGRRLLTDAPVWVVDGNAYTSRPGPRLVDGAQRLQSAMLGREMDGLVRWRPL